MTKRGMETERQVAYYKQLTSLSGYSQRGFGGEIPYYK
jgi:hypothetical protein